MTRPEANKLANGIYVLFWVEGGRSLAAVHRDDNGDTWYCPINWISGSSARWHHVATTKLILTQSDLDLLD